MSDDSFKTIRELLRGIEWSFSGERFASRSEFENEVEQDQRRFKEHSSWRPGSIAIELPRIHLRYMCPREGEYEDRIIEIASDDGESFTQGELLFKIHNAVVEDLRHADHHFFEGLTLFRPPMDEIPPLYDLCQGS